jgi:hypothetical protein
MPIDHADPPDDADGPHPPDHSHPPDRAQPPGRPQPPGRAEPPDGSHPSSACPPSLDANDRAAAHRSYQAKVDQAYAAERTWAKAVPSLRAAWAKHQDQYPERTRATPQTHPDNSWSSGEARKLTPDENTQAAQACADMHDEGDRFVLPSMRRIEAADPDRRLAGLEHMLKGADRMKEKIAERLRYHPDLTPRQAATDIPDAVRFTFEYRERHYTEGVVSDVERLTDAGYELLKLKNLWSKDQYKGINSQWRSPDTGLRFEVQFHTPQSLEAKELTHQAYERLRDPLTSKAEETALVSYQRQVNALVRVPSDVFGVEDYPPEKRDG